MDRNLSPLERAFQLAEAGACATVTDIKKRLKSEGYATTQIEGRTLSKQLALLIRQAKAGVTPKPGD
jgi:hypothetical protein